MENIYRSYVENRTVYEIQPLFITLKIFEEVICGKPCI